MEKLDHTRILTKYERAKVIGIRAEQISRGAQCFVEPGKPFDAYEVAEREFVAKVIPYVIVRHHPDGKAEHIPLDKLVDTVQLI